MFARRSIIRTLIQKKWSSSKHLSQMVAPSTISSPIIESMYDLARTGSNVNFPRIVMIGNQSSGKTSAVEAMCGINNLFPKKAGLATQRPVHLYFNKIQDGETDYVKIGDLGEKISNMERAQLRISEENKIGGTISSKPLEVAIYSSRILQSCTVVDLPGYISTVKNTEDDQLPEKIRQINEPYINDSNNLKVIVFSATEDVALSLGLKEVKRLGQLHNALGVFTKIDLITNDQIGTKQLESILTDNGYTPFQCIGVKLRSSADIENGVNITEMLRSEQEFIKRYNIKANSKLKVGVDVVMRDIANEQIKRIYDKLPEIRSQLTTMIEKKRYGNSVLDRLVATADMTLISEELDRIITEIHPESDLRIELEKKIANKINAYIKEFFDTEIKISDDMKEKIRVLQKPQNFSDQIQLSSVRNSMVTNYSHIDSQILSKHLSYGLCKADVEATELDRIRISNLNDALVSAFYKLEKVSTYTKSQFVKNIQKVILNMVLSRFSENIVNIVLNEIKDHILKSDESSDDLGKIFFIHVFDKICERANQDELKRAITRMIIREKRLDFDYSKLILKIHGILEETGTHIDVKKSVGLFGNENFPMGIEMYGPLMFKGYMLHLADQISNDSYRLTAENLLDSIIINTIKYSLDIVSKKDFTAEQKTSQDQINKLIKQLDNLDNVIREVDRQKEHEIEQKKKSELNHNEQKVYQKTQQKYNLDKL